jgi:hypothetical protein
VNHGDRLNFNRLSAQQLRRLVVWYDGIIADFAAATRVPHRDFEYRHIRSQAGKAKRHREHLAQLASARG